MTESNGRELTSWKEIAEHLGVSVRTAQKWEGERGLPVRRLPGGGRGRVVVTAAELEAWKLNGSAVEAEPDPVRAPGRDSRLPWIAAGGLALVLSAGAGVWWWAYPRPVPTSFRIDAGALIISDENGREMWRKTFEAPLLAEEYATLSQERRRVFWTGDLDGDGKIEVLFSRNPASVNDHGFLVCFSDRGSLKWKFQPGKVVMTTVQSFSDNFAITDFDVAPTGPRGGLEVYITSSQMPYYPNQVAILSAAGEIQGEYWHSGHLTRVAVLKHTVYLGGISNGYHAATLIALDRNRLGGASVEADPEFQLLGFPPAREKERVVFQRTCVNRLLEPYNRVLRLTADGQSVTALVTERSDNTGPQVWYYFDPSLKLRQATLADSFRSHHAELRAKREVDHDLSAQEEVEIQKIRYLTR